MNRRELIMAALAAPVLAMPFSALASTRRITWNAGTMDSPHALMAARYINQLIRDKLIYTTGEGWGFGHKITLSDPRFVVSVSDIMWHPTRGFRHEPSLSVEFFERGFRLGDTFMYSMADYEDYWNKPKPDEYPDFGLRALHTPYERFKGGPFQIRDANWQVIEERPTREYVIIPEIEEALGRDAVGMDDRWIRQWIEQRDQEKQKARLA